jgi:hypothetical protein
MLPSPERRLRARSERDPPGGEISERRTGRCAASGPAPQRGARTIQTLAVAGGVAAPSWEVMWQLQASLAFGVSALGTALTLAATMGGMALGAAAAGSLLRLRRVDRPLRLYGCGRSATPRSRAACCWGPES